MSMALLKLYCLKKMGEMQLNTFVGGPYGPESKNLKKEGQII